MSNPWAQSFEELRSPYLQEKMAKKDYDGDGKIETGTQEYMGSRDKAIKKAMGKKVEDKKKVAEHHQKDANGNTIPHEDEGDGTPSSVEEAKIDTIDPKNKRKRRNERAFGKQTKPYDPDTKEMKTSMGKFMNSMRHKQHQSKRGRKTTGPDAGMKKVKEEIVLEADKKGKGSGTKDACYHKVKSRYSVWPSAYASGALVKCRKAGAKNWGNSSKKEEFDYYQMPMKSFGDMVGECWKTHKQVGTKMKGGKVVPNCVPKNEEAQIDELNLDSKGRMKLTAADVRLNSGAYKKSLKDINNKIYSPVIRADHYEPEGKVVVEMDLKKIFKLKKGSKTQQDLDPTSSQKNDKLLQHNLGRKFDKAHYEPKGEVIEAVKSPKLDVKETGVKNKIEINPEIKTEAANAPVKK